MGAGGDWELMLQVAKGSFNTDRRRSRLDMVEMEGIVDNREKIQKQYSGFFNKLLDKNYYY